MGTIALERGHIGVLESGPASALTPIIFLHGVGSDKSVWAPQFEHFGRERRALAFDYPGYGESAPRDGAGRDGFAAAMIEAMASVGINRAHLCGLSLGGVVAIAMHHLAPGRCASLILADSFARHPEGDAIYERSVGASKSMTMRELAETRAPALLGASASDELRREVIATMAKIDPAAYRQGAAAVWLADQRDRAAAINIPSLILCGEEDRITPPLLSKDLASLIYGAQLAMIPGAGHLTNAEQPHAFNTEVDRFLAGVGEKS